MLVFHGSNVEVRNPRIVNPSRTLDVGPGFYTATNREQAIGFLK